MKSWRFRTLFILGVSVAFAVMFAFSQPSLGLALLQEREDAPPSPQPPSRVVEATILSNSLGFEVPYVVYLPAGYDSSEDEHYPVVYMLHGLGGDRYQARVQGLFMAADVMIASGEIEPMIIVAPEGQRSYWVNHANNGPRWGNYITQDLVGEVDRLYRTIPDRASRAIGGVSMGGHGALQLAMTSDVFGVAGAHSVALRTYEQAFPFFGDRTYFEAHDPVSLCAKYRMRAQNLKIWIDIGADDTWQPAASAFHQQLLAGSISHEWKVYPGGHDLNYWHAHAGDYLRFYNVAMERPR